MIPTTAVTQLPLDILNIRNAVIDANSGGIVIFEGCTRNNHNGKPVQSLTYEAFEPMAESELGLVRQEAMNQYNLNKCIIHHRLGMVPLTETALIVACSAAHRREAFEAAMWIVDRIKEKVPIWKYETYDDSTKTWVDNDQH
jgi:molybdopterin synthase catalytic subunit